MPFQSSPPQMSLQLSSQPTPFQQSSQLTPFQPSSPQLPFQPSSPQLPLPQLSKLSQQSLLELSPESKCENCDDKPFNHQSKYCKKCFEKDIKRVRKNSEDWECESCYSNSNSNNYEHGIKKCMRCMNDIFHFEI